MIDVEDRLRTAFAVEAGKVRLRTPVPTASQLLRSDCRPVRGVRRRRLVAGSMAAVLAVVGGWGAFTISGSGQIVATKVPENMSDARYLLFGLGDDAVLTSAQRVAVDPPKNTWTRYPPYEPGYTNDSVLLVAGEPSVDLRRTSPSRVIAGREVFLWSSPPDLSTRVFQAQYNDKVCGTIMVELYNTERFDDVIPQVRCEMVNGAPQARLERRSFDDAEWTSVTFGLLRSVVLRYRLTPASGPSSYVTINLQRLIGPLKLPSSTLNRLVDGRRVVSRLEDVNTQAGSEKRRVAEVELSRTESAFLTMPPDATWDDVENVVRALRPVNETAWETTLAPLGVKDP